MPIYNDDMLNALLMLDLNSIIEEVTDKILQKLQESIEENVYDAYSNPDRQYNRNKYDGGLIGEFVPIPAKTVGNIITASIEETPELMIMDLSEESPIHGSIYKGKTWDKIREALADMIIKGTSGIRFGEGDWTEPRDFWTPVIKMFDDGTVRGMVDDAFTTRGIKFIRG